MRFYETLYILNPNYEQDRLEKIMDEINKEIDTPGVSIINHRVWGKKRLAYPIQKHKYGIYILLQFELEDMSQLKAFDTFLNLNRGILRHQTVRLDSRPEIIEELLADDETENESGSEDKPGNDGDNEKSAEEPDEELEVNEAEAEVSESEKPKKETTKE